MCPLNSRDVERRVDLDTVFRALSHPMRRRILTALMTDNPRWQDEFETVEFRPEDTDRGSVSIALHHRHLPPLDDAGFIDVEPETGRVSRGENFDDIRPLLELMDDHKEELPDDWP